MKKRHTPALNDLLPYEKHSHAVSLDIRPLPGNAAVVVVVVVDLFGQISRTASPHRRAHESRCDVWIGRRRGDTEVTEMSLD